VLHARQSVDEGEKLLDEWREQGIDGLLVVGAIDDERVFDRFGRLDVFVNSAAVWEPAKLEDTSTGQLKSQWSTNTLGAFLCAQQAGLAMVGQKHGGSLILIGDWAIQRPYRDFSAYMLSKGCIPTLCRTLAVELAERNPAIRVNAILPGPVLLDTSTPEKTQQRILEQCLLRRAGTAADVARAAVFLAEQPFVTGVCLPVDGGRSIDAGRIHDALAHPSLFE
jgi:pteridine reductase